MQNFKISFGALEWAEIKPTACNLALLHPLPASRWRIRGLPAVLPSRPSLYLRMHQGSPARLNGSIP
jgi:hypothetical protein